MLLGKNLKKVIPGFPTTFLKKMPKFYAYFQKETETYTFKESIPLQMHIKTEGIKQFLELYKQYGTKSYPAIPLVFGDEIEQHVINFDQKEQKARLQTNNEYLFERYAKIQKDASYILQPEFGA